MDRNDWITDRLAYLRALKTPSAAQRMLLQLADLPERSRQEEREFKALLQLERVNERAEKAKVRAYKIVREKEDAGRRQRTRRLIELGALFDLAGIGDVDRGVLLGGLIEIAEDFRAPTSGRVQARFKARGDALLADRERGRISDASQVARRIS